MIRELKASEFNESLEPIFRSVESRLPESLQGRKAEYFFPKWRHFMDLGIAKVWHVPDAVLGMLITPDIFSGDPVAHVPFWFSKPGTKGTVELLKAAEKSALLAGCKRISIAAFDILEGDRIAEIYRHNRYVQSERTFTKELN